MISGKFAITVHILTLLTKFEGKFLSSEFIASSINVNPVLVRKEIANLKSSSLVESKEGKHGGTRLAKSPTDVSIDDIFKLTFERLSLGYSKNEPNPSCTIGKQINKNLEALYGTLNQQISDQLKHISLKDFSNKF